MGEDITGDALAECASCGHHAPAAEMIADLTVMWVPTGKRVCRDGDGCFTRRLARDRERVPADVLRPAPEAETGFRYCATCRIGGNDDSRLGRDRVHNVEGAPAEGLIADVCEQGHVFPIENEEEAGDA